MSWRNQDNHKEETKVVKAALQAAGINAKVGHGHGTAWAWLKINIGTGQQFGEHTHVGDYPWRQPERCQRCREMKRMAKLTEEITQKVTGRHGEWGGEINIHESDDWNQKKRCSVPITHPNWKTNGAEAL